MAFFLTTGELTCHSIRPGNPSLFTKQATTVVFFFPEVVEHKWLKTQALGLQRPAFKSWLLITSWLIQLCFLNF